MKDRPGKLIIELGKVERRTLNHNRASQVRVIKRNHWNDAPELENWWNSACGPQPCSWRKYKKPDAVTLEDNTIIYCGDYGARRSYLSLHEIEPLL